MGRPPIFDKPMTHAEHQRRYREGHADLTNATRQARLRAKKKAAARIERTAVEADALASDPQFASAQAILEAQGETDLLRRLRASWPHMAPPVREQMAAGRGFRFWLRED
jgi:hypothetical protein